MISKSSIESYTAMDEIPVFSVVTPVPEIVILMYAPALTGVQPVPSVLDGVFARSTTTALNPSAPVVTLSRLIV